MAKLAVCLFLLLPCATQLAQPLAAQVIYHESFDQGNGSTGRYTGWTQGKNVDKEDPPYTWHKNAAGHFGYGAALEWQKTGGMSGSGYVTSSSPWYWDDNHGEFYWFHLVMRLNLSKDIGVDGKDLRNAMMKLVLRGRDLDIAGKDLKLFLWIQGESSGDNYYVKPALVDWAFTGEPLQDALRDGQWHEVSFKLDPNESRWSQMGLINGGLAKKLRVIQSRTMADGTLAGILGGKHWNFGFLLCGIDPRDLPTGKIDIDDISITANH